MIKQQKTCYNQKSIYCFDKKTVSFVLCFLITFSLMSFAFWLGGFDFNERGFNALTWFVSSMVVSVIAIAYLGLFYNK